MKTINVAQQFSPEPGGRYPSDGDFSGERFREELLKPILQQENEKVVVDFDGTEGYGSSFLDEAFAGLVRLGYVKVGQLRGVLEIRSLEDPTVIDEVWGYIEDAEKKIANSPSKQ